MYLNQLGTLKLMFKIPLPDIIEKVKSKSGLSEEEINQKIEDKLKQLSGLISREGAGHIIANELGVKLIEQVSGRLQIKNILAGMRDVETVARVTTVYPVTEFTRKDGTPGKVGSFVASDETGSIRIVLWGDQANLHAQLGEGTMVKILGGYVRENSGRKEVHLNERSKLIVDPEGESVETAKMVRKQLKDLEGSDENVEIFGTIVQVYDPRFFEICPECKRRARPKEDAFVCDNHGKVEPVFSYLINVVLDDGSGNIQAVFFRNQMETLLEKSPDEVLGMKDNQESIEKLKSDLLGNQIKVVGRVNNNEMFDRLEFVAQSVVPKPDPQEEIDKLKEVEL